MAKPKDWIQHSIPASHQGKFADKAKAAGMSTAEFAREKAHAPGTLGEEAREAETLMHLQHRAHAKAVQHHLNQSAKKHG
ncbi:MAG: hypothetical protein KGI71_05285 [Patescibacteria group bacterium]|nr:hypothetical protein [Patescibacteria group bacterium]